MTYLYKNGEATGKIVSPVKLTQNDIICISKRDISGFTYPLYARVSTVDEDEIQIEYIQAIPVEEGGDFLDARYFNR